MEEPNVKEENEVSPGLALGIDFGNSKISGAVWDTKKKAPSIVLIDEKIEYPSTLYYNNTISKKESDKIEEINMNSFEVGAGYTIDKNMKYFIYDIKKLIGQRKNEEVDNIIQNLKYNIELDQEENILYNLEGISIHFEDLLKILISKIKNAAEIQYKEEVKSCTISVPHGFNNNQRMSIRNAASIAGIQNIYIINEPLSTAIYYISQNKIQKNENILIIDFGSSKLDVSLLSINDKNSIKIKNVGGDSTIGGDIFNKDIVNDILNNFKYDGGKNVNDPQKLFLLENLVEKAKKELTFKQTAEIKISQFDGEKDLQYILKRQNFNELNNEAYNKIYNKINKVIIESKINIDELDHIIIQGNAMRIIALTNLIKEKYENVDIITDLYDSIALGNAIYTAKKINKMNNKQYDNFKVYDITPISLGLRTEGDLMSVILPRGSRVPIKAIKRFVTTQDNQNIIKFEIYEGERKLIKYNKKLVRIDLKNIPQMNKKEIKVEVIFEVDEDYILTVTCKELSNNIQKSCKVVINEDLTQKQIMDIIEESKKNNEEDLNEKERIKAMLKLNDKIFEYSHLNEGNEDILRELEGYRNWIKHSAHSPKEEYETKLSELNDRMNIVKNKIVSRKQTGSINLTKKMSKTGNE